ncbi:MAG: DUF2090 domain-containing protein [Nitriliruptor sp.]
MSLGDTDRLLVLSLTARAGDGPAAGAQAELPPTDAALDGLDRARAAAGLAPAQVAVVIDGADAAAEVRARGFAVVARAEIPAPGPVVLEHEDGFGRELEELDPTLTSIRVRWNPADDADRKKEQALVLTRLGAWLHETERRLLVEVVVPPTDHDLAEVDGDHSRFVTELRPALTLEAIREIRELGTEPDIWGIETGVAGDPDLAELITDAGRDQVAALVLADPGVAPSPLEGAVRGLILDPRVWATGAATVDAVAAALTPYAELHATDPSR